MKILIAGLGSIGRGHLRNLVAMDIEELVLLRSRHYIQPFGYSAHEVGLQNLAYLLSVFSPCLP